MRHRIAAHYVYALDDRLEPLRDAYVEYDDEGCILEVGLCEDFYHEANVVNGAIVPGFVNAHCHVELSHLQGRFRKGSGMAGFIDQINELRDFVSREEKIKALGVQMEKMWSEGVQAMADVSNCNDSFALKAASPMYTRSFLEVFGTEPEDCQAVIDGARSLKAEADAAGIDAGITPHSCYTMSPELLTAASAEGLATGYLSYHSQESRQEEDMIMYGTGEMADNRRRAGMSTPPVLGQPSLMYFIDRLLKAVDAPIEQNILLVHNVCLSKEAIDAARKVMKHPYWAVCPLSNIFIHNALPPVGLMKSEGLKICVGTDSLSSNDELDMVKEIFCLQENNPKVTTGEILSWACRNGAEFLGKSAEMGSLSVGKTPGIVAVSDVDGRGRFTKTSRSHRII